MSLPIIHISVTFDTTEPTTIELDVLQSKLNWSNLVALIESMHPIETPITLYYKKQEEIECLQNQEQLNQLLLTSSDIKGLRFYSQKEQVIETVYVYPGDAFARLGRFVNQHKSVIATSHRLARSVGLLATFIAQDTTDNTFDLEFQALGRLVERKLGKSKCRERKEGSENVEEQEAQDPRELLFGRGRPFGRHGGGRGGHFEGHVDHFGGRGGHGGGPSFGGGRGRHHHGGHPFRGMQLNNDSSSEECTNTFGKRGDYDFDGCPGAFGMHAKGSHGPSGRQHDDRHHGGRHLGGRHLGGRHLGGRHLGGRHLGGRHLGGRHLGGRRHSGKGGCGKKKLGHSSSEESSGEEEARAMHHLKKQHKRDFKRFANHFHFA